MKKLFTGLMATTLVLSSTSSLVACSKKIATAEIYLITDAGKVTDKSFNESGFNAGNIFLQDMVAGLSKNPKLEAEKFKKFEKFGNRKISKIEPENTSTNVLKYQYTNARNNGAKVIILPGFHHSNKGEGESLAPAIMDGYGSTIMLDGPHARGNEIGFLYRGDISGFYAGMGAIIWSLKNDPKKEIILGSFGGMSFSGAVDNFIVGYLAAIEVMNKYRETNWADLETVFGLNPDAKNTKIRMAQDDYPKAKNDPLWFSNSFLQGDGKVVTEKLLEKKATVIMPVAGPQTLDVLGLIKERKEHTKVVGVDTNQAEAFLNFADGKYFITSAEKDLVRSTIIGLAHTKYWVNETYSEIIGETANHEFIKNKISLTIEDKNAPGGFKTVDLDEEEVWDGKTLWVGGSMSYDGHNLLREKEAKEIKKSWGAHAVTEASKYLFAKMPEYDKQKDPISIISKELVEGYAKIILENSKKSGGTF